MRDFTDDLSELRRRVDDAHHYLHIDTARLRIAELEAEAPKPDLWDDPDRARSRARPSSRGCKKTSTSSTGSTNASRTSRPFTRWAREEGDESLEPEIEAGIDALRERARPPRAACALHGEHDERDAICEVHSGAGGTDAQDWARDAAAHVHALGRASRVRRRDRRGPAGDRSRDLVGDVHGEGPLRVRAARQGSEACIG